MLGRDGAQAALAAKAATRRRSERPQAEPGDGRQRPGLLGEVLPLLGCRAAHWCRWRASGFHLTPAGAIAACDENTIGVVAILGSTFDGSYEPVAEISAALDKLRPTAARTSRCTSTAPPAGSIAPFLDPDLVWDFRLPRVPSINASGHKYGLVYPGVGWALWRDKDALPEELVFNVNYLGGNMPTFALNFSRPGARGRRAVLQLLPAGPRGLHRRCSRPRRDVATALAGTDRRPGPSSG